MNLQVAYYNCPVGVLEIKGSVDGIEEVNFRDEAGTSSEQTFFVEEGVQQLDEYFKGKRREFSLKINLKGTAFQKKIWNELLNIPYGKTMSYLELAMKHGDVKAIRAVGAANGKNPVAIIVPCHRVIGAGGELVGYAGGLQRKKWLLDLEGSLQPDLFSSTKAL